MTIGLIGKKLGMTQRFFENGESLPVTVLKIEKAIVDVAQIISINSALFKVARKASLALNYYQ